MIAKRAKLSRKPRPAAVETVAVLAGFFLCWILVIDPAAQHLDSILNACQPNGSFVLGCYEYASAAVTVVGILKLLTILAATLTVVSYVLTRYYEDSLSADSHEFYWFLFRSCALVTGIAGILLVIAMLQVDTFHTWMPGGPAHRIGSEVGRSIEGERLFDNDIFLKKGGLPLSCTTGYLMDPTTGGCVTP